MDRRKKQKTIFLVVFGATAIANCWYRGPVFGIMPFLIFALPFVALVALFLHYVRLPRGVAPTLGVLAGAAISYSFCAPPSTSRLFRECLKTQVPEDLRDLRRWNDNWARDPPYFLRFHATEATIDRLVSSARLEEGERSSMLLMSRNRRVLPVPAWWRPDEIQSPRVWHSRMHSGGIPVELRFDPETGLAYLTFFTL